MANFDFSDKYQPVLLMKHSGKQVFKDRRLKLPVQIVPVFEDYVKQYKCHGTLFPYTQRTIELSYLLKPGQAAGITKASLRECVA